VDFVSRMSGGGHHATSTTGKNRELKLTESFKQGGRRGKSQGRKIKQAGLQKKTGMYNRTLTDSYPERGVVSTIKEFLREKRGGGIKIDYKTETKDFSKLQHKNEISRASRTQRRKQLDGKKE